MFVPANNNRAFIAVTCISLLCVRTLSDQVRRRERLGDKGRAGLEVIDYVFSLLVEQGPMPLYCAPKGFFFF